MHPGCETFGIEVEQSNAQNLGKNADYYVISDVEAFDAEIGDFDLILFLDVLEHLRSPEAILAQFTRMLRPGGAVIISVPAVSYIGVSLPLVLKRRFDYRDSGILDRTHTRLFVETTAVKLANDTGLSVDSGLLGGLHGFKSRVLNTCTFGIFRHYLTKQYILRAHKADGPQKTVRWRTARY
jgi:SAM-dependent methyltransferase